MTALTSERASGILQALLLQGGWRSHRDAIAESFPHLSENLKARDLINALENLQIPHRAVTCRESAITAAECPALLFFADGRCAVLLDRAGEMLQLQNGDGDETWTYRPRPDRCLLVRIDRWARAGEIGTALTVRDAFVSFRQHLPCLLVASFLSNGLGLVTPLLIMAIYDRVIPTGSQSLLWALCLGVAIVFAADFGFRHARTRALAHVGSCGERALTVALFGKLMALPTRQVTRSDPDQQLARFRQLEAIRDIFTGQVVATLLDLPFALIFLGVLFALAPAVGVLLLVVIALFAVLGAVAIPHQTRLSQEAAEANALSRSAVRDAVVHQQAMVNLGLGEVWLERAAPLAARAERANHKARQFQNLTQATAQSLLALATAGAIILSTHGALSGALSFGALIAVIALASKVLAPVQSLQASVPQILSFFKSRDQADRALALPGEPRIGLAQSHLKTLRGEIDFKGVTFRPDPLHAPLLSQLSFTIEPGETVLIMGNDVAGRTALLDLIDGLHEPMVGSVEHDRIDIRQIARDELRRSISYATFASEFFYGTVTQNLRLAAPSTPAHQIDDLLRHFGLVDDIAALPEGMETRLKSAQLDRLPQEVKKALALVRCLARQTPIVLLSEPTQELGPARRAAFKSWLGAVRGRNTVVIATPDQSLIPLADRFMVLDHGRLAVNDTGDAGMKKLKAALQQSGD